MRTLHRVPRKLTTFWLLASAAAALVAAALLAPSAAMAQGAETAEFTYLFHSDAEGWTAGFADLPADHDPQTLDLDSVHRALPDGLHQRGGILMQGHNRSDDLFMYLKRQVDGLLPNTEYDVSVSIDLATNVPAGLIGIGGSPGESVFVKAGASTVEPAASEDDNRHLRMNIDKGNQSLGGEDMVVIGNVAHSEITGSEHRIKRLDNTGQPLSVESDDAGRVWLIVGTDSGFEGFTAIYYARISYTLTAPELPPATGDAALPRWAMAYAVAIGAVVTAIGVVLLLRNRRRRA
ncbi:MAG: hypothetical protein OXN15_08960 [Chloroflexota bacterium]|nr:hypothetical protein [Chloroflexota bacterium]